jgi:diguanylate cyclase (GGDEF)-like protein
MAFFKRRKQKINTLLGNLLNMPDIDILVMRPGCETLFRNTSAQNHQEKNRLDHHSCKSGYSLLYSDLCQYCPAQHSFLQDDGTSLTFDVEDIQGHAYSASCDIIEWTDGKPATVMCLRNIDRERAAEKKLYTLAYTDHLTGIPNRQKFKEDFEEHRESIGHNQTRGIVAMFDLDNFKIINDTYGHNTGDIMLQKLAAHLTADAVYDGHLYRLGGDEFVLFYADPISRFPTETAFYEHYDTVLGNALQEYTLPIIDLTCTISMGVSVFPEHGTTTSELLRKADIALYKSKSMGRNTITFFEEHYDKAKKPNDLYIDIQPVMKEKGEVFGYELIDQGKKEANDGNSVVLTEFERTLDALGLEDIENDTRYFISYSHQLLSPSVRLNLPKDKFVIQFQLPTRCKRKDLQLYRTLRACGYSLAFSDLNRTNASPALLSLAHYVKFDYDHIGYPEQNMLIKQYDKISFVATNVDNIIDFENAQIRGFRYFQGYYFQQPVITKKTKDLDPLHVNYYRLLQLSSAEGHVDFKEISDIIASDVVLSYKLLRLLNSAALGLRYRISSISTAVTYLGEEKLKKWISLLSLRGLASDTPLELMRISLIRAQFAELLAPHFIPKRNPKHAFFIGMFSLLHIALDKTKEELLSEIPVAEEVHESLLQKDGIYSDLISLFSNYEYSNWEEVNRFAQEHRLSSELINDCYVAAVKWYNDLVST